MRYGVYVRNPVAWLFVVALMLAGFFEFYDGGAGLVPIWFVVAFVTGALLLDEHFAFKSKHKGDDNARQDPEPRSDQEPPA